MFARFQITDGSIVDLPGTRGRSRMSVYAYVLPVVIGLFSVVGEGTVWYELGQRTQVAADAAAIAAVRHRASGDRDGVAAAGLQAAANSGFVADRGGTGVTVLQPANGTAVEAHVSHVFKPVVAAIFPGASFTVTSRAVADIGIVGSSCVIGLQSPNAGAVDGRVPAEAGSSDCLLAGRPLASAGAAGSKGNH